MSPTQSHIADPLLPVTGDFHRAATVIKQSLGLSLFGFDVIIPTLPVPGPRQHHSMDGVAEENITGSDLLVIDVNFFPSYKEVSDFPVRLRSFLRDCAGLPKWIPIRPPGP